jgi:hypothetical protein
VSATIHDVIRHLVEHSHFGSDENRKEALDAVDAEYKKDTRTSSIKKDK